MDEFNVNNAATLAGGLSGLAVFSVYIWRIFTRRFSRDGVETAKDRAEVDIIAVLREQARIDRDRAEKAEFERNDAFLRVGELQGQIAVLNMRLEYVVGELNKTRDEFSKARQQISLLVVALKEKGIVYVDNRPALPDLPES